MIITAKPGTPALPDSALPTTESKAKSLLAEMAYKVLFGRRPVTIHILPRGIEHDGAAYVPTVPMWPYIHKYAADNKWAFCTVDLAKKKVCFDGWGWGWELLEHTEDWQLEGKSTDVVVPTSTWPHTDKFVGTWKA